MATWSRKKIVEQARRAGRKPANFSPFASEFLDQFCSEKKSYVQAQYLTMRRKFERSGASTVDDATFNEEVLNEFEKLWGLPSSRLLIIPGKEALGAVNKHLQEKYGVNITVTSIIDSMKRDEISPEMEALITELGSFALVGLRGAA